MAVTGKDRSRFRRLVGESMAEQVLVLLLKNKIVVVVVVVVLLGVTITMDDVRIVNGVN